MKTADDLKQLYRTQFFDSGDKINVIAAPGRVTLLGEHIGSAPGLALSAAISGCVYIATQRQSERDANIYSAQYDERVSFSLNSMAFDAEHGWANFPKAAVYYLERSGAKLPGFNMVVDSDLPEGAGLSSSTALTVATTYFCYLLGRAGLEGEALFRMCHTAETKFLKQSVELTDPLTIGLAEEDKLLLYDHADGSWSNITISPELALLVAESSVREARQEAPATERMAEAAKGLEKFSRFAPGLGSLRQLTPQILDKHRLKVPVSLTRACRHVAGENARAGQVADLLHHNDLAGLGRLLGESHASLSKDFRVSHHELDFLVQTAAACPGFLGARMFGPGLGGPTLNLVMKDKVNEFSTALKDAYRRRMNMTLRLHAFSIARGVHEMV